MAVARIAPYARQYTPPALLRERGARRPRPRLSLRTLALVTIVGGWYLQHALVSMPLEAQPAPLALPPLSGATTMVARRTVPHFRHSVAPQRVRSAGASLPPPLAKVAANQKSRQVLALTISPRHAGIVLPPVGIIGDAARKALAPNPLGLIVHAPSVSVGAIRAALQAAGSPILQATYADHKDAAEYVWDSGRVLGVDPAVVMAIFHHESVYGTRGMAVLTHSVGNIRPLLGQPSLDGYRYYSSWEQGIDDCFRLLISYARHGAGTIPQAIPVWAPPSDNNDDGAYIASVLQTMGDLYAASSHG